MTPIRPKPRRKRGASAELGGGAKGTVVLAYELGGLDSVGDLRRVLHIVLTDTVSLENSVSRSRTLISLVQAAAKLLEVGEFEERLIEIEAVLGPRTPARSTRR